MKNYKTVNVCMACYFSERETVSYDKYWKPSSRYICRREGIEVERNGTCKHFQAYIPGETHMETYRLVPICFTCKFYYNEQSECSLNGKDVFPNGACDLHEELS
jgi:hypothetical protein